MNVRVWFDVTQEDIDNGRPYNVKDGPVSLALYRILNKWYHIVLRRSEPDSNTIEEETIYTYQPILCEYYTECLMNRKVEPKRFWIDLPSQCLREAFVQAEVLL